MESQKIIYMTPKELRGLDLFTVRSMQMKTGDTFLIAENIELQQGEQNYAKNEISSEVKLRARKEVKDEEEEKEEKKEEKPEEKEEEKVEIEIGGEANEENDKKEILRGPDGKPLLSEMLTYGGLDYGNQGQSNENNVNLYPVPQNFEPVVQPNIIYYN